MRKAHCLELRSSFQNTRSRSKGDVRGCTSVRSGERLRHAVTSMVSEKVVVVDEKLKIRLID